MREYHCLFTDLKRKTAFTGMCKRISVRRSSELPIISAADGEDMFVLEK